MTSEATPTRYWRCTVCGYIAEGDAPPERCPVCGATKEYFEPYEPPADATPPR